MKKCNCGCGQFVTPEIRFWQKVAKTKNCWNWTGTLDKDGYGKLCIKRKGVRAHRYSYELHSKKKIPRGLVIDHLCRNTRCVNPSHLEVVTNTVNILRGFGAAALNAKKTYCINNHPLFGENLYVQPKTGKRFCRICDRKRGRELYKRKTKNAATK